MSLSDSANTASPDRRLSSTREPGAAPLELAAPLVEGPAPESSRGMERSGPCAARMGCDSSDSSSEKHRIKHIRNRHHHSYVMLPRQAFSFHNSSVT